MGRGSHLEGSVRPTIRDTTSPTVVLSAMYVVLRVRVWVVWVWVGSVGCGDGKKAKTSTRNRTQDTHTHTDTHACARTHIARAEVACTCDGKRAWGGSRLLAGRCAPEPVLTFENYTNTSSPPSKACKYAARTWCSRCMRAETRSHECDNYCISSTMICHTFLHAHV